MRSELSRRIAELHQHPIIFSALCGLSILGCGAGDDSWSAADEERFDEVSQALCTVSQLTSGLSATASSQETSAFPANLAIDGNATTRWSSTFSDSQWIRVDLGQTRYVENVVLVWEAASAADYRIELSTDGNTWTTAKTVTGAAPGARTDTLTNLSTHVARYVRVFATRRNTPYGYSLYEVKVYGDASPGCNTSAVCGNGVVESAEQCDDGNSVNTDACSNTCKVPSCGDTCGDGRSIGNNLEAETHDGMVGIQYEATTDVGGGQNAGYIAAGDYIQWKINVPVAGDYTVTTRSATWAPSNLQLLVDGAVRSTMNLPNTYTGSGNRYQTWASFTSTPLALTVGTHTLRAAFTSANQNLNWVKVNPVVAPSKVEIRTPLVDDFVYLSVNGLRHRVGHWGMDPAVASSWRDVSSLFRGGFNDVRVQGANGGGPGGLDFEIRVNGGAATRITCPSAACSDASFHGMFIDQAVSLPSLDLPASKLLTVTSQHPGKLYINDEYIGLSTPATIQVPSGSYTVGVGVSNDTLGQYTGRFHEKNVVVGNASVTVDMETAGPSAPVRKAVRFGLLPLRTVVKANVPAPGVLTAADADRTLAQLNATNTKWLVPFSYGLSRWEVTRLPMVTDWVGAMDGTCQVLDQPAYAPLLSQYDFIFVLHSEKDVNGNYLSDGVGGYAVGQCVVVPNTAGDTLPHDAPNPLMLHEILHQYERYQVELHHLYNGVSFLHGAPVHGFLETGTQGEPDWTEWYRYFIRGQVGEIASMRPGVDLAAPPVNPSYFVGTFSSIKYGMRSPAPR